jgi:pimeloyl-ACP methyl ester carboxylesterase
VTDAPLAPFGGDKPTAPAWFDRAIADEPARRFVEVDGARIEALSWGDRGKPGLLLLHGNGAHADWWSFIAPFFAADFRVAALSWSGMGGSDHRDGYTLGGFVAEAFAVAEAEGLFDSAVKPVFVGHSFGGMPLMACAARHGARLRGAVMVDTPVRPPGMPRMGPPPNATRRPHKVYPTLAEALARFRLAPPQGCENLYIADFIARTSLKQVEGGWQWKFDPFLWSSFRAEGDERMLSEVQCPFALMWGDRSMLMPALVTDHMRSLLPTAPVVVVPEAEHHVMIDQPLAFVTGLRALIAGFPA